MLLRIKGDTNNYSFDFNIKNSTPEKEKFKRIKSKRNFQFSNITFLYSYIKNE